MKTTILLYLKNNAMSQQDLADQLGISKQYLNQYLNGQRDDVRLEIKIKEIIGD